MIGSGSAILLLFADFGHAVAHILSARYAGAPMDEIRITEGMSRTIYRNNQVSPNVHRLRTLGGPIFNVFGLLLSLTILQFANRKLVVRRVDWGMGIALEVLGVGLLFLQVWVVGLILVGAGIVVMGIAKGKIQ